MQRVVCCSSVIDSLGWILRVLSVEQISVIYKLALSPFSPEIVPKLRCTRVVFWMVINRCFAMVLMWRIQLRRSWSMARWFSCEPWSRGTRQRKVLHRRWPSQSDTAVCADSRSSNLGVHFTVMSADFYRNNDNKYQQMFTVRRHIYQMFTVRRQCRSVYWQKATQ